MFSNPGISKWRYEFGVISFGINFDDKYIKTLAKYKVKPIGIKTTTPVKKKFLSFKVSDFFFFFGENSFSIFYLYFINLIEYGHTLEFIGNHLIKGKVFNKIDYFSKYQKGINLNCNYSLN